MFVKTTFIKVFIFNGREELTTFTKAFVGLSRAEKHLRDQGPEIMFGEPGSKAL